MTNDHGHGNGLARPLIPFMDVEIRTADARVRYTNEHVVYAVLRFGHILQFKARLASRFNKGLQRDAFPLLWNISISRLDGEVIRVCGPEFVQAVPRGCGAESDDYYAAPWAARMRSTRPGTLDAVVS